MLNETEQPNQLPLLPEIKPPEKNNDATENQAVKEPEKREGKQETDNVQDKKKPEFVEQEKIDKTEVDNSKKEKVPEAVNPVTNVAMKKEIIAENTENISETVENSKGGEQIKTEKEKNPEDIKNVGQKDDIKGQQDFIKLGNTGGNNNNTSKRGSRKRKKTEEEKKENSKKEPVQKKKRIMIPEEVINKIQEKDTPPVEGIFFFDYGPKRGTEKNQEKNQKPKIKQEKHDNKSNANSQKGGRDDKKADLELEDLNFIENPEGKVLEFYQKNKIEKPEFEYCCRI